MPDQQPADICLRVAKNAKQNLTVRRLRRANQRANPGTILPFTLCSRYQRGRVKSGVRGMIYERIRKRERERRQKLRRSCLLVFLFLPQYLHYEKRVGRERGGEGPSLLLSVCRISLAAAINFTPTFQNFQD